VRCRKSSALDWSGRAPVSVQAQAQVQAQVQVQVSVQAWVPVWVRVRDSAWVRAAQRPSLAAILLRRHRHHRR
jgi:hypothetical protein